MSRWISLLCSALLVSSSVAQAADGNRRSSRITPTERFFLTPHDNVVDQYIANRFTGILRAPLDAAVYKILTSKPEYQEIMDQMRAAMHVYVEMQRREFEGGLARAGVGRVVDENKRVVQEAQYQKEKDSVVRLARKMGVSPEARKDMRVYIYNTSDLNAFTYSGDPKKQIDVVLYKGLLTEMSPVQVEAVVGHEIAHILAEHVLINMTVQAIFDATLQIVIPDEEELEKKEDAAVGKPSKKAQREMVRGHLRQSTRKAMARAMSAIPGQSEYLEKLLDIAQAQGKILVRRHPSLVQQTAVDMIRALAPETLSAAELDGDTAQLLRRMSEESEEGKKELMKKLEMAMERLSRSMEQTCDNHAISVVGARATEEAMTRLVGGKEATVAGMKAQGREFYNRPHMYSYNDKFQEGTSHPGIVARVAYPEFFERSLEYLITSDTFFRAIDLYLNLSKDLKKSLEAVTMEPMKPHLAMKSSAYRTYFTKAASSLREALVEELLEEVKNVDPKNGAVKGLPKVSKLIAYLELTKNPLYESPIGLDLIEVGAEVMDEMGRPGRLLREFTDRLSEMAVKDPSKAPLYLVLQEKLKEHFTVNAKDSALSAIDQALKTIAETPKTPTPVDPPPAEKPAPVPPQAPESSSLAASCFSL